MSFEYYRNRKMVDVGGGSCTYVTNVGGNYNAKHSRAFYFSHCGFSHFKGTALTWKDITIIVSDKFLDSKELKEYTDEQCLEIVLDHVSADGLLKHIAELIKEARRDAVEDFKEKFRDMFGIFEPCNYSPDQ